MFRSTFFPSIGLNIFHAPEKTVSEDALFESELLFVWDDLQDPYEVKKQLGRFVPFASGVLEGYECKSNATYNERQFSLNASHGEFAHGVVLIGLTPAEFDLLDRYHQTPIRRRRDKATCRMGLLDRVVQVYFSQGALIED